MKPLQRAVITIRAWRKRREALMGVKPTWTSDEMWEKIKRSYPSLSATEQEQVFQEAGQEVR